MSIKLGSSGIIIPYSQAYVGNNLVFTKSVPYTMLDWLESTGLQYIDTGIYANNTIKVEIKISNFPSIIGTYEWGCVFGSRASAGSSDEYTFFKTNAGLYRSDFAGNRVSFSSGTDLSNISTIIKDGNQTTIGSETITNTSATFTSNYPIWLFACNNGGTEANKTSFRFYYCKIWDNDVLVRDFIPVIDESNVVCLFDKVSKEYFYNKGQGKFVPNKTTEYTTINYLESTGNQYINSAVTTNDVSYIDAIGYNTFGLTYSGITYGNSMLGARASATNSNFQYANGAYNEFVGNGTAQLSLTRNTNTNILHLIYKKWAYEISCGNYNLSGTLNVTISTPLNIYLFGLNNNGTFSGGTWKIKNVKMYDSNNVLIRDFIPVIRKSDNSPCLYDFVNNTYYTNAGTGTFLYG